MAIGANGQADQSSSAATTSDRLAPAATNPAIRKARYTPGPEVGSVVLCEASFASTKQKAHVIEKKLGEDGEFLYYVHYEDFDKRLDEWVPEDKLSPLLATHSQASLHTTHSLDAAAAGGDSLKVTRSAKRRFNEAHHVLPDITELPPLDQHLEKEHQEKTKVKNIEVIELGAYEVDTWYYSPYPEPYASQKKLYHCEFCLKYFKKKMTLLRHLSKCELRFPPGDEIYRSPPPDERGLLAPPSASTDPAVALFEVDGKKAKVYCQSLCLLSKLFLDHKTLYYDVDPFLFYILCERDAHGHYHIVGYFSKEKHSVEGYNLACILTLPPHQRKGYGRLLIDFSYALSRKEQKTGTPERPLSDLGNVSYRSYWTHVILEVLREHKAALSIEDISELTSIRTDDITSTLTGLNLIKYWKGDHIISVTSKIIEDHMRTIEVQRNIAIDISRLHWVPYGKENG